MVWEAHITDTLKQVATRFCEDTSGATAIEYALLASLIGIGIVGGASLLGENLSEAYNNVGEGYVKASADGIG